MNQKTYSKSLLYSLRDSVRCITHNIYISIQLNIKDRKRIAHLKKLSTTEFTDNTWLWTGFTSLKLNSHIPSLNDQTASSGLNPLKSCQIYLDTSAVQTSMPMKVIYIHSMGIISNPLDKFCKIKTTVCIGKQHFDYAKPLEISLGLVVQFALIILPLDLASIFTVLG